MEKERFDDAAFDFQKALALEPSDFASLGYLGICYGRAGKTTDGMKLLQDLDDLSQRKYVPPFYRAVLLLGLGRRDQSLEWLERAFQARIPWMIFLKVWPIFDAIRTDPKFLAFSQKLMPGSRDK